MSKEFVQVDAGVAVEGLVNELGVACSYLLRRSGRQ